MKKLIQLLTAPTPKVGKKIGAAGIATAIVAAAPEVERLGLIENVPLWVNILQAVCAGISAFLIGAGYTQNKIDPDNIK